MEWTLEKSDYCENIFLPRLGKEGQQYCEGSYWTQGLISHFTNSSRFIFSPFFFASLLISIFDTSPTPWLYDHWWGLIHIVFGPFPHIGPHTYRHNETFCCYFLSLQTNKRTWRNVWMKSGKKVSLTNHIFWPNCPTSETVHDRVNLEGRLAWSPINNVNSIPHGD